MGRSPYSTSNANNSSSKDVSTTTTTTTTATPTSGGNHHSHHHHHHHHHHPHSHGLMKKGAWTPEEDQKLIDYINEHGHGNWRALPKKCGLMRCGKSCRLRWTNYLRPDIKRGAFTPAEEQKIIQLHALVGNKWAFIASQLPKRTDNEIKNYWNTVLKKRTAEKQLPSCAIDHNNIMAHASNSSDIHSMGGNTTPSSSMMMMMMMKNNNNNHNSSSSNIPENLMGLFSAAGGGGRAGGGATEQITGSGSPGTLDINMWMYSMQKGNSIQNKLMPANINTGNTIVPTPPAAASSSSGCNHLAQWETARLEAEARLAHQARRAAATSSSGAMKSKAPQSLDWLFKFNLNNSPSAPAGTATAANLTSGSCSKHSSTNNNKNAFSFLPPDPASTSNHMLINIDHNNNSNVTSSPISNQLMINARGHGLINSCNNGGNAIPGTTTQPTGGNNNSASSTSSEIADHQLIPPPAKKQNMAATPPSKAHGAGTASHSRQMSQPDNSTPADHNLAQHTKCTSAIKLGSNGRLSWNKHELSLPSLTCAPSTPVGPTSILDCLHNNNSNNAHSPDVVDVHANSVKPTNSSSSGLNHMGAATTSSMENIIMNSNSENGISNLMSMSNLAAPNLHDLMMEVDTASCSKSNNNNNSNNSSNSNIRSSINDSCIKLSQLIDSKTGISSSNTNNSTFNVLDFYSILSGSNTSSSNASCDHKTSNNNMHNTAAATANMLSSRSANGNNNNNNMMIMDDHHHHHHHHHHHDQDHHHQHPARSSSRNANTPSKANHNNTNNNHHHSSSNSNNLIHSHNINNGSFQLLNHAFEHSSSMNQLQGLNFQQIAENLMLGEPNVESQFNNLLMDLNLC